MFFFLFSKMNTEFWNETLHFSLCCCFFCFCLVFLSHKCESLQMLLGECLAKRVHTKPETADVQVQTASILCHFPLGVTFPD